jgi:hypothetical protein
VRRSSRRERVGTRLERVGLRAVAGRSSRRLARIGSARRCSEVHPDPDVEPQREEQDVKQDEQSSEERDKMREMK